MDFTSLTDDQLVELVRAAVTECATRGTAVAAAAQAAMLSEAEKAQIAREASAREAERLRQAEAEGVARDAAEKVRRQAEAQQDKAEQNKQNRQWGRQKTLAQMVVAVLGSGWRLNVWHEKGETRVYLDRGEERYATGRVEYYHTGNFRRPPRTLLCVQGVSDKAEPFVQQIVETACKDWNRMRMDCDEAATSEVAAIGEVPAELTAYGVAWRAAAAEHERQAEQERRAKLSQDGLRPVIYIKTGVTQTIPNQHPPRGSRGRVIAVTRDEEDPARLDVVTIETAAEGYWSFRSLINLGTVGRTAATEWPEGVRSLFTPEELALVADPAALPALDYDAIHATLAGWYTL